MAAGDPPIEGFGRATLWASAVGGALCSLLVAYRLLTMSLEVGSAQGNWVYVYLQGFQPSFVRSFVYACIACGLLIAVTPTLVRRLEWWTVVAWLAVGLFVQGSVRQVTRYSFEQIFVSDGASSFYSPTLTYDTRTLVRDFEKLRPQLPTHAQSNMPGKLALVGALRSFSDRPLRLAWVVILISNLGGLLLYWFVRELLGDRDVAITAVIFYLLVPAKLFFFPVLNTVTPVIVLACACLWLQSLRTRRLAYAAGFGVAVYALAFFDPLGLVMGLLFAALAVHVLRDQEQPWRRFGTLCIIAAGGFLAAYAVLLVGLQFDLVTTFVSLASDASAFNTLAGRPYSIWVRQNIVDFLFGLGVCNAVLATATMAFAANRSRVDRWRDPIVVFSVACGAILIATDVIGINRGEVVRLWIFLACFFQVLAAHACVRLRSRTAVMLVVCTMLLQSVLGTGMLNFAQP